MTDPAENMMATKQELRSGLPGLGGRPKLHPAWGELGQNMPVQALGPNGTWRRRSVAGDDRLDGEPAPR